MGKIIPISIGQDHFLNLNTYICSPLIPKPSVILFYVDTGSPKTIISEAEAIKLGIDVNKLKTSPKAIGGFGEGRAQARLLDNVCLVLKDSKEKTFAVELNTILISMKKRGKKKEKYNINIPNVIGADFFKTSELSLFVDYAQDISYLEKK